MSWIRLNKVVVIVMLQMFVSAFVLSLWQLHREQNWESKQETITSKLQEVERVGKYILLYKNISGANSPLGERGSNSGSRKAHGNPSLLNVPRDFKGKGKVISRTGNGGGGEQVMNNVHTGDMEKGNGDAELKEERKEKNEEDPVEARGFLDEYVFHRSDNKTFLMVEDDKKNLNEFKIEVSHNHSNALTKETVKLKEFVLDSSARDNNSINSMEDDAGKTKDYKFRFYDPRKPFTMIMTDDQKNYFQDIGSIMCFTEGTYIDSSKKSGGRNCHCRAGYFGVDCGIPEAVWFDTYLIKYPETRLTRRMVPRRVINGIVVNHEFVMFEARLHELYPVVDAFIVAESNYTSHGDSKERFFLDKLRQGYMHDFQDKLLYVGVNRFPDTLRSDGWLADSYLRVQLGYMGIPLLKEHREDDLFILSDADELPSREVVTFLKLYDGYPEPISFAYQWNVFGFFWKVQDRTSMWNDMVNWNDARVVTVMSVATLGMVRKVMLNNVYLIRKGRLWGDLEANRRYVQYRNEGHLLKEWVIGTVGHYAGWHCSWCFSPVDIVHKMNSAQSEDKPRFGDMPEKKNLTYITSRIQKGIWFDDKEHFIPASDPDQKYYAPPYLLQHPQKYRSILYHPDHQPNQSRERAPP